MFLSLRGLGNLLKPFLKEFPSPHGALFLSFKAILVAIAEISDSVSVPAWGFVFVIADTDKEVLEAIEFPSPHGALFLSFEAVEFMWSNVPFWFPSPHGALFLSFQLEADRIWENPSFRPRMGLCFCHFPNKDRFSKMLAKVSVPAWGFVFVIYV